jgi:hypothetical protein
MMTIPDRNREALDAEWSDGHAAPADRALGLELELIELNRQRDELLPDHPEAARLDRQIREVMDKLVEVSAELDDPEP